MQDNTESTSIQQRPVSKKSKVIRGLIIGGSVVVMIILLLTGYFQCPVRVFLHYKCPFCGICRAVMSAFRGDMANAFYYHPLWPLIVPTFIVEVLDGMNVIKLPRKANDIWLCIGCVLLIGCYIYRIVTNTLV